MLDGLRRAGLNLARGVIHAFSDSPKLQTIDFRGLQNELITAAENFAHPFRPLRRPGAAGPAVARRRRSSWPSSTETARIPSSSATSTDGPDRGTVRTARSGTITPPAPRRCSGRPASPTTPGRTRSLMLDHRRRDQRQRRRRRPHDEGRRHHRPERGRQDHHRHDRRRSSRGPCTSPPAGRSPI